MFELILPVNNIFPKPSIVFQSLFDLFKNYQLGWNYLSTVSAIYFPLILAYYLVRVLFPFILQKSVISDIILSVEWFSRYIPGIILAMILIYWFPQSEFTKFIFAFLISFSAFMFRSKHLAENLGSEYSLALQSFGVKVNSISQKVIWKAVQPDLMAHIIRQNIYLWASVILFEYINLGYGLGTLLRKILQFKDLSALIMIFLIIGVSIFISTQLFKLIKNKFYFWKA
ncbi:MAG: ABC transporter permease subunit [Ignavibacteriales bacterium]|nr:ABC transporter permease subunit [Ignavibacteriales bacterium]